MLVTFYIHFLELSHGNINEIFGLDFQIQVSVPKTFLKGVKKSESQGCGTEGDFSAELLRLLCDISKNNSSNNSN